MDRLHLLPAIVVILLLLSVDVLAKDAGLKAIDSVLIEGHASIGTKAPSNILSGSCLVPDNS